MNVPEEKSVCMACTQRLTLTICLETVHSVISVMSLIYVYIVKTSKATIGRFGTIVINLKTYLRYVNVCDNNYTCKNINMNYIVQQRFNKTKIPQIIIPHILFNSMFLLLFHFFS